MKAGAKDVAGKRAVSRTPCVSSPDLENVCRRSAGVRAVAGRSCPGVATEDATIARQPLFRPDGSWWGLTSGALLVFAGMAVCYGLNTPEVVTRWDWFGCDRPAALLVTITGMALVIFGVREIAFA